MRAVAFALAFVVASTPALSFDEGEFRKKELLSQYSRLNLVPKSFSILSRMQRIEPTCREYYNTFDRDIRLASNAYEAAFAALQRIQASEPDDFLPVQPWWRELDDNAAHIERARERANFLTHICGFTSLPDIE